MKFLTLTLATLLFVTPSAYAIEDDIVLNIDGMSCEPCAATVTKALKKETAVKDVSVSLDDKTAIIDTEDGQTIDNSRIKELIDWAGFDLVSIKRN